jgi:DNA polymerase-3 subunit beta
MNVKTEPLKTALESLQRIVKGKSTLPVLNCVKMEVKAGTLELTASNLDEYQLERIELEGVGHFDPCCVSLVNLLWAIGGESVSIERVGDRLVVAFDSNETDLAVLEAEEFPVWPKDKLSAIGVSCVDLASSIRRVAWASAKNNSGRWILESVHVSGSSKQLKCEATDGKYLAIINLALIGAPFECVIPELSHSHLAAALERTGSAFSVCENYAQVSHDAGAYLTKQIDGNYPNTASVVPAEIIPVGTVKLAPLLAVFNRCAFYAASEAGKFDSVKLDFSKIGLHVQFTGSNSKSNGLIAGEFSPAKWSFGAALFKKVLSGITGDEIKVSTSDAKELGVIVIDDSDMRILAMPVRMT